MRKNKNDHTRHITKNLYLFDFRKIAAKKMMIQTKVNIFNDRVC